jgi:alkylation response protein AidB-like acyl-CoA dehydrogenase
MDFQLPADDDPRRVELRSWLAEHPSPSPRQLAEAGLVAPHWPRPWGRDADPLEQLIIDAELRRARVFIPNNAIGIGWAGPTLVAAGTEEQKERYLLPLLAGEEIWCQLFSEPGAGSDLANISTRAVRDGDEYVITGQKVWTSYAHGATFGILLARTNPDVAKHRGISYFIFPMRSDGVEIRPITEMTGVAYFNEVFMDEVRIPAANLVGEEHGGWPLARLTLANERVSLSSGGALWGMGPRVDKLVDVARAAAQLEPGQRDRLVRLYVEGEILRLLNLRAISQRMHGGQPGPEASVKKIVADEHGQRLMDLAKDMAGPAGMLADRGPLGTSVDEWHWGFLFSRALTIGGGTGQVLRSLVAERVLGLPRDIDVEAGKTWAEARA